MREILFRGKRVDNGEWVIGFYSNELFANKHYISKWYYGSYAELQRFEVIPETVGQFTGRTDNNGNRIFEGDILRQWNSRAVVAAEIENCGCCNDVFGFSFRDKDGDITDSVTFYNGTVIGNIHDNPELL